ncbi:MAG: reverse transcriptase-like protein [Xenococcaceae cyanobacterium MO_207.B15]|nr:reverse transcriptase-like protein [Xenococcaceae cyanobacterium MO_207.B15]
MYRIYLDASYQQKIQRAGIAIIIISPQGHTKIIRGVVKSQDNNIAEIKALLVGLNHCHRQKLKNLIFYTDSKLVSRIRQLKNGKYKQQAEKIRQFISQYKFKKLHINWIARDKNVIADTIARNCLINSQSV